MRALLLTDIQHDFLPGGALAVPEGDRIIQLVNRLQEKFDLVLATQDWHPAGHKSFASSHPGKQVFDRIDLHGLEQVLWPDHCVQGTVGAELSPELNTGKVEVIFRKGMEGDFDSYSGFYDNGYRKSTALADYLRGRQVEELYLVGLAGDYCVYFSAKDALQEGFKTFVIEDATRPIDPAGFEKAKQDIREKGGQIILSSSLF
jgi:nicotinamidase/pyrazinamidase